MYPTGSGFPNNRAIPATSAFSVIEFVSVDKNYPHIDVSQSTFEEVMSFTKVLYKLVTQVINPPFRHILRRVVEVYDVFGVENVVRESRIKKMMAQRTVQERSSLSEILFRIVLKLISSRRAPHTPSAYTARDTMINILCLEAIKLALNKVIIAQNENYVMKGSLTFNNFDITIKLLRKLMWIEMKRFPLDELHATAINENEGRRFYIAITEEIDEVSMDNGRIYFHHFSRDPDDCKAWFVLRTKILGTEYANSPAARFTHCATCEKALDTDSKRAVFEQCEDLICVDCAMEIFAGSESMRCCPVCEADVDYWTTVEDYNKMKDISETI